MTCADFEKLTALDVEGDLPERQADGLKQHLPTCPHCQAFAEDLQASQALLKELAQETPDEATLQEVRRGVLDRLRHEAPPVAVPVWQFALAGGLIAALVLSVILFRHSPPATAPRIVATRESTTIPVQLPDRSQTSAGHAVGLNRAPATPAPARDHSTPIGPKSARQTHSDSRVASARPRHPEPLLVKLFTDNPNVVIYWQVD